MTYPTLKLKDQEYVLVPRAEFQELKKQLDQNRRDARKAHRAEEKYRAGKLRTIPHEVLKENLRLDHHYAQLGKRAIARFKAGKSKAIPLSEVMQEFGL